MREIEETEELGLEQILQAISKQLASALKDAAKNVSINLPAIKAERPLVHVIPQEKKITSYLITINRDSHGRVYSMRVTPDVAS